MYNAPCVNEYFPLEYPELSEYIPEPAEYQGFQWNPVPTILPGDISPPDMSKGEYSLSLARDAYKVGIMPVEMSRG
jgi:hypothetical protein